MPDQAPWPVGWSTGAVNLISTATHQFAGWYDLAGELRIGRIERGVQRWGVDHDEYTFAGAPRTTLALPTGTDEHNYISIAIDGNGHIHLWANMHANTLRAVKTVDPHTDNTWLATAGWTSATGDLPSVGSSCSYPTPLHLLDGSLFFCIRDTGDAAQGDWAFWTRTPSGTTWSARTLWLQGLVGANWSAYMTVPVVEPATHPHPSRIHVSWVWRDDLGSRNNELPSYAYTDDNGATWKSIEGDTLTLPITPLNNPACQMGIIDATGYGGWGGLVLDDDGAPHIIGSFNPKRHITWNGSSWEQPTIAATLNGVTHTFISGNGVWYRGSLWFPGMDAVGVVQRWRIWQLKSPGGAVVVMSGDTGGPPSGNPTIDPEAWRRFGAIEMLSADGNKPIVESFGNHARLKATA